MQQKHSIKQKLNKINNQILLFVLLILNIYYSEIYAYSTIDVTTIKYFNETNNCKTNINEAIEINCTYPSLYLISIEDNLYYYEIYSKEMRTYHKIEFESYENKSQKINIIIDENGKINYKEIDIDKKIIFKLPNIIKNKCIIEQKNISRITIEDNGKTFNLKNEYGIIHIDNISKNAKIISIRIDDDNNNNNNNNKYSNNDSNNYSKSNNNIYDIYSNNDSIIKIPEECLNQLEPKIELELDFIKNISDINITWNKTKNITNFEYLFEILNLINIENIGRIEVNDNNINSKGIIKYDQKYNVILDNILEEIIKKKEIDIIFMRINEFNLMDVNTKDITIKIKKDITKNINSEEKNKNFETSKITTNNISKEISIIKNITNNKTNKTDIEPSNNNYYNNEHKNYYNDNYNNYNKETTDIEKSNKQKLNINSNLFKIIISIALLLSILIILNLK